MQDTPIKLKIIIGSTRKNRFSEKPAHWIFDEAKKITGVEAELLDLRNYPLPFFDEPVSPSYAKEPFENEIVKQWTAKIKDGDAFIVVTPEYNHGYPAVLKNAMDYVFKEWHNKPIGFIGYGSVGGARSIEQLRQVVIELQMTPIRTAIHIPSQVYMAVMNQPLPVNPELFVPLRQGPADKVEQFLTQLISSAKVLKAGREQVMVV